MVTIAKNTLIAALKADHASLNEAATTLKALGVAKDKAEATKMAEEAGFVNKARVNKDFDTDLISYMAESSQTRTELMAYILEHGTPNKARFESYFNKTRIGLNTVRGDKDPDGPAPDGELVEKFKAFAKSKA